MALHLTPEEHDADPPSGWIVRKSGRKWQLCTSKGGVLDTFDTKKAAEAAKTSGFNFNLYEKEGRWFKGETPPGMKSYAECKAEQERNAARNAQRNS